MRSERGICMTKRERRDALIAGGVFAAAGIAYLAVRAQSAPAPGGSTTPTAVSATPTNIAYSLTVVASASVIQTGQPVSLTVEPMVSWQVHGVANNAVLAGQTINATGTLGTFTIMTAAQSLAIPVPSQIGKLGVPYTKTFTNTPTTPTNLTEILTWTDPAGGTHSQTVTIQVSAKVNCPELLLVSIPYPPPTYLSQNARGTIAVSYTASSAPSLGCPFSAAVVSTTQAGVPQQYIVVVGGGYGAQLIQTVLTNNGWQNVQVGPVATGTIQTVNGKPAIPISVLLGLTPS